MGNIIEELNYTKMCVDRLKNLTSENTLEKVTTKIEDNYGSSEEWQPEPDWWDIDKILEEDTEDYPAKMICLLSDPQQSDKIKRNGAVKIVTSDGTVYKSTDNSFNHTWDTSKDKQCYLGYKTRYIIWYFDTIDIKPTNKAFPANSLYIKIKDGNFYCTEGSGVGSLRDSTTIQAIESNSAFYITTHFLYGSSGSTIRKLPKIYGVYRNSLSLSFCTISSPYFKEIDLRDLYDSQLVTDMGSIFDNSSSIYSIKLFNTENVKTFTTAFRNCSNLRRIENLNLASATSITNMFQSCKSLVDIYNVTNIKISGISLSDSTFLSHSTLVSILDALEDYSDGETHTITLGTANITKLTNEELAIGQNKNWTIS